jgi:hypothetical protein
MILVNEELMRELAQITLAGREGNRDKEWTAEQAFNMLCLHHVFKVPVRDIAAMYRGQGDPTIIHRICYPEGHHDARYPEVRALFFRLLKRGTKLTSLCMTEEF